MNKHKIIKWILFCICILLFVLMIILSIGRAAICFLIAAFFVCPFLNILEKLDTYIQEKHRKRATVISAAIFAVCGGLSVYSHYYYIQNPPVCTFSSFDNSPVEISYYHETGSFIVNAVESEFDANNLEFISENADIAEFKYDHTILDDHIYYSIEPVSGGETYVYVRCKECGAESKKIHVTVNLPERTDKSTETTNTTKLTTLSVTTTTDTQTTTSSEAPSNIDIRNENLNGRGTADSGRSEPDYINVIGYAVISTSEEYLLKKNSNFTDTSLWTVPTFEQDKQFWNETGYAIPHKTEVSVRNQFLNHEGYGKYSGYLLVEKLDDGTQHYIDVNNFITKPYWEYNDDLKEAALTGTFIAEYNQKSNYYPVGTSGEKVELNDGLMVLVTGISGSSRSVDPDETGIEAIVWNNWSLGYGEATVYFNTEDLTIIY